MTKLNIDSLEQVQKIKPCEEDCNGIVFRYSENNFLNSNGDFVQTFRMRRMRRKSCPGCETCDWMHDCYREQDVVWPKGLVHGEFYTLAITNESRDWESGVVDDFDLEFVKMEEK